MLPSDLGLVKPESVSQMTARTLALKTSGVGMTDRPRCLSPGGMGVGVGADDDSNLLTSRHTDVNHCDDDEVAARCVVGVYCTSMDCVD